MSSNPSIFDQGATLLPDLVTEPEERRLLQRIYEAPWSSEIGRRVQHYGFRYDYRARADAPPLPAAPFPRWAEVIGARLAPSFGGNLPEQCIVNEYLPGQGIGMHADHEMFGPAVVSLSLAAGWTMQFRPRSTRPYARAALPGDETALLPARSALVLHGAARTAWMHGLDPATNASCPERVSVTFRTLAR